VSRAKKPSFFLQQVKEIRDRLWVRPEDEKSDRNRKKASKNYERRGDGKGFRENQEGENTNNQTGFNRRSKPMQWQQRERKKATNTINDAAANQSRD